MSGGYRNVVILGKVGAGKKTLANHIFGKEAFHRGSVLGADNVDHRFEENHRGDTKYRILTVDTESSQSKYNDPLPFITKQFQTIHMIVFVIANGRYTKESHDSLLRAIQSFDQRAKSISALVITHCEGIAEARRIKIVEEFQKGARSSQVAAFMGLGTYVVGFPDTNAMESKIKQVHQKGIDEDQANIWRLMECCKSPMAVGELFKQNRVMRTADRGALSSKEGIPNQCQEPKVDTLNHERHVIIFGKKGSGKKTLKNHIEKAVASKCGTRQRGCHILPIDTESLQDNDPISSIVQHRFHRVNLIIFVVDHTDQSCDNLKSLVHVLMNFHCKATQISALVITHCDMKERELVVSQFRADIRHSSHVAGFMGKGVYAVGFPDISELAPQMTGPMRSLIDKDRKVIGNLVRGCELLFSVESLQLMGENKKFKTSDDSEMDTH